MSFDELMLGVVRQTISLMGTSADYTRLLGESYTVRGIFSGRFRQTITAEGGRFTTSLPTLGVVLSDFSIAPAQGDRFVIASLLYEVTEVQEDGYGGATLILREVV